MRGGDLRGIAVAVLAAALSACGAEPPEVKPSGPSMAAKPPAGSGRVNQAPQIERLSLRPSRPRAGEPVRALVEARDPDGDRVQLGYHWERNGRAVYEAGAELPAGATRKGDVLKLTVTASDGEAAGEARHAEARVGNQAPLLRSVKIQPERDVKAGMNLSAVVDAEDPDGDRLRIEYVWRVNGRVAARGEPNLPTTEFKRGDEIQLAVVAHDDTDESRKLESAPVRLSNASPEIRSKPEAMDEDGVFRYAIQAEDHDGDRPLHYELVEGPRGMRLDPVTGEITWQPGSGQSGRHPVEVAVGDRHGGVATQRFELIVDAPPASPE